MEKIKKAYKNKFIKGGLFLTLSTVIAQGLALPMSIYFTNKMGSIEFGNFSIYMQFLSIINIIGSLNLASCILRGKHEFEEEYDQFFNSIVFLGIGSIITASCIFILGCTVGSSFGIFDFAILPQKAMILMTVHSVFLFLYNANVAKMSSEYKHTEIGIVNVVKTLATYAVVIGFFYCFDFRTYYERILGTILVLGILSVYIMRKQKRGLKWSFKKEFIVFAVAFSTPLIIHTLSSILLNFFDSFYLKVVQEAGLIPEYTQGVYSLAYKIGAMVTVLWGVCNKMWTPWFFENMKKEKYSKINEAGDLYVEGFSFVCFAFLMVLPELGYFIDDPNNLEGFKYVPLIALGCYFIFLYSFPSNTEFYHKKTKYMSFGSLGAVILNIILNLILIPRYGAWAAALTTLV